MPVAESVDVGTIAQAYLKEFETQAPITRRYLERLPEDKLTWKPHEKSMTAGQLALHIASVPGRIVGFVQANPGQVPKSFVAAQPASLKEILIAFDECLAAVRSELPKFPDEAMREIWRLQSGETTVLEQPRGDFLRDVMLSHIYQHRGQLSVYLRMLELPVPASWGPSGDEPPLFAQKKPATV
ncbi:MAG: DinB family protein [Terracidiphilus sp.]